MLADPKVWQMPVAVLGTDADVAVQGERCLAAEGDDARSPALAENHDDLFLQVEIIEHDADALASPEARVHQQANEGRVPPGGEVLALACLEQTTKLIVGEDGNRVLRDVGWLHAVHRMAGQLVKLLHCPGEE